jgi:hypothetical protein
MSWNELHPIVKQALCNVGWELRENVGGGLSMKNLWGETYLGEVSLLKSPIGWVTVLWLFFITHPPWPGKPITLKDIFTTWTKQRKSIVSALNLKWTHKILQVKRSRFPSALQLIDVFFRDKAGKGEELKKKLFSGIQASFFLQCMNKISTVQSIRFPTWDQ